VAPVNANLAEQIASGSASADDIKKASSNPASGAGVKVGDSVGTATTTLNNGNKIPSVSFCRFWVAYSEVKGGWMSSRGAQMGSIE